MKGERHIDAINEVLDEIETSLKDDRGVIFHQRRIAFSLSLGVVNLIELHFHEQNVIKEGSKINHKWFKRKKDTLINYLQQQITSPINSDKIIEIAIKIEEKRDDLAYGAPSTEKIIQEKINLFFELKELIEWKI
jgi:hypothetical protein